MLCGQLGQFHDILQHPQELSDNLFLGSEFSNINEEINKILLQPMSLPQWLDMRGTLYSLSWYIKDQMASLSSRDICFLKQIQSNLDYVMSVLDLQYQQKILKGGGQIFIKDPQPVFESLIQKVQMLQAQLTKQ